jgi:hypothetical protein
LLAFAQVLAFAHVALVAHRICAEHGEAIHASQPGQANAPAGFDSSLASVVPSRGAAVGHAHEHCLCMAYGRDRFLVPQAASDGLSWFAAAHRCLISSRTSPALSITLLLIAPKGSPPV